MKICKVCGSQLEDYAAFCTNCGTTVDVQPQQPVNNYDYYAQPEVGNEVFEDSSLEEPSLIENAKLFIKKIKTALITSIVSTSLIPFYAIMYVVFFILAFIPIVNIISGVVWLFVGTAIIIAAIVCVILAWLNAAKAKKIPEIFEGDIDDELFVAYQSSKKKMKVANILAIVSTVLIALLIIAYVLYLVFVIIMILGVLGIGLLSDMQYYF